MTENERPVAFIAMEFDSDHWRDKRYKVIKEELEHVGYVCVRADEIRTSGPSVDEVCRLLKEADLVVIDSSGDSPSVSYEIGYCHGIGRATDSILLLRYKDENTNENTKLPFSYQHYRHRFYKDLKHLRRLIRDYCNIIEPLSDDQLGYTFTFSFTPEAGFGYIKNGAFCIFDALGEKGFSGRCECYTAEQYSIPGHFFSVGIILRYADGALTPEYKWWLSLQDFVEKFTERFKGSITLEQESEMVEICEIKTHLNPCGAAEFINGRITRLYGTDNNSFLSSYAQAQQSTR